MEHTPDLIFDVGMHNGDDTAYYLHKGFRVVAIEANPARVRDGEVRFKEAIAAGRLKVLSVGIAAEVGEAEFFVSTEIDVWSSFDKEIATRGGRACEAIRVPCLPFSDIVGQYGVPYYCKIDIEGADHLCLEGLTSAACPPFISIEMIHEEGNEHIQRLTELGYDRFQCIRQNDYAPIHDANM